MPHPVHIAIWPSAHDPMDGAIKFLTHGKGTHAAFVRGTGKIAENFWPHVRERNWLPGEWKRVEVYNIEDLTEVENQRLEDWIDRELKHPPAYSIWDLFRYALNWPPAKGRGCFCSQWVMRGLRDNLPASKQILKRLEYQDFASPTQLRSSPRLHPVHYVALTEAEL